MQPGRARFLRSGRELPIPIVIGDEIRIVDLISAGEGFQGATVAVA